MGSSYSEVGRTCLVFFLLLLSGKSLWAQCEITPVTADSTFAVDDFGESTDISGDFAVVGAPSAGAGAAFVYQRQGLDWVQVAELLPDGLTLAAGDEYGAAVAIDGRVAVVGARKRSVGSKPEQGVVYTFRRNLGGTWEFEQELIYAGGLEGDYFGHAVDISGDWMVIGSPKSDDAVGLGDSGTALTFRFDGNEWTFTQKLRAEGDQERDNFGDAVAIDGNWIAVGAKWDDDACPFDLSCNSGSVTMFFKDPATELFDWTRRDNLTAQTADGTPVAAQYDFFGSSLDIDGDRVVVGSYGHDAAGSGAGAAFVYRLEGLDWVIEQRLTASDAASSDGLARLGLAIRGDLIIACARSGDADNPPVSNSGTAYFFERSGTTWTEVKKLAASDATVGGRFGVSTAIGGDYAIVGANQTGNGKAYILAVGTRKDCNANLVHDDCELLADPGLDANGNAVPDTCECSDDSDCEGVLPCATGNCNQATHLCEFAANSGFCLIHGICYVDGEVNASDACEVCDASALPDGWSAACPQDGVFCNGLEFCVDGTCFSQGDPCTAPGLVCDAAAEVRGACSCTIDAVCDDGLFCNGVESCSPDGGCQSTGNPCQPNEVCVESLDRCECDSDDDCPEDGVFCNGEEICVGGACESAGDPCALPTPLCDEAGATCLCVTNADCNDGAHCNGEESCDVNGNCLPGTPPCPDPLTCDPDRNRCVCALDEDCNDSDACTGTEFCNEWGACRSVLVADCNGNGLEDSCDINGGSSSDCDANSIRDDCQDDCNGDGIPDACELWPFGVANDCDGNGVPDDCDLAGRLIGTDESFALELNQSTGAAGVLSGEGMSPFCGLRGLAFDMYTETLYTTGSGQLLTLDPATGSVTPVGPHGSESVVDLAFDPNSGILYGVDGSGADNKLLAFDKTTGMGIAIANLAPDCMGGLAFDPVTDTLYGLDYCADQLLIIDPDTGLTTVVGVVGTGGTAFSLAFDPNTQTLVSANLDTQRLIVIDTGTGAGTLLGSPGSLYSFGLAFQTSTGSLYGVGGGTLLEIDALTGAATEVGIPRCFRVAGLTVDPSTQMVYAVDEIRNLLIVLDRLTGVGTPIGAIGFSRVVGLAVDPNSGVLFATDRDTDQLITIDKSTGAGTAIGPLGTQHGSDYIEDLAFSDFTGILYGVAPYKDRLMVIDTKTGTATTAVPLDFEYVSGIAFDSDTGTLYGTDRATSQLIEIDTATGRGTAVTALALDHLSHLAFDEGTNRLYAHDDDSNQIGTIDSGSGQFTFTGVLGFDFVRALAYDRDTSTLYGIDFDPNPNADRLIRIDAVSGNGSAVAAVVFPEKIRDLAFDSDTRTLYGISSDFERSLLSTVNTETGAVTPIATVEPTWVGGIAYDPDTNTMYGYSRIADQYVLLEIDATNGNTTEVGPFGPGVSSLSNLALDTNTGSLYTLAPYSNQLLRIDSATGEATVVGSTQFGRIRGLAYAPDGGVDCNASGVLDQCDIEDGFSLDCQPNGRPDECETADCNENGIPDDCEIADGVDPDCNQNLIPDDCDVESGASLDCQANGIPDECEAGILFTTSSSMLSPFDGWHPQRFRVIRPPLAGGDVTLAFSARADLGGIYEITTISLNNVVVGEIYEGGWGNCTEYPMVDTITVRAETYNAAVAGGDAVIDIVPEEYMDECWDSGISVAVSYQRPGSGDDCNANGVPDDCETDCNGNGVADECDLTAGGSTDCNRNHVLDECDIRDGTSLDCQLDGVPDECDVTETFTDSSDVLSPVGAFILQTHVILNPPLAGGDVMLTFFASANLNGSGDFVEIYINGVYQGYVFPRGTPSCAIPPVSDTLVLPASVFNDTVGGGHATIDMRPGYGVDSLWCAESSIAVTTSYEKLHFSTDCNQNQTPDECDIRDDVSLDCQTNGIPDECETDCNGNGVPDDCDIRDEQSLDCQPNGIPDDCEPDCNENGVADSCDLASGLEQDCNVNSIPDSCDISIGGSPDCNDDGIPDDCQPDCNTNGITDECDLTSGASEDCNGNDNPDECDISDNSSADCNTNSIPDECEAGYMFISSSGPLSPLEGGHPLVHRFVDPPLAVHDVSLTFTAHGDLASPLENIGVSLNGDVLGTLFEIGADDCVLSPDVEVIIMSAESFNTAIAGGDAVIEMVPTEHVDADGACQESYISVTLSHYIPGLHDDCNFNGVPDECDVSSNASADCNTNAIPDECELDDGTAQDCNGNFRLDECDIVSGLSADCQPNGIPDECEVEGLDADCNRNNIPDEMDILCFTSSDCQVNGVPDECEVGFIFTSASNPMSPMDATASQSFRVTTPPPAGSDVELAFTASGDLSRTSEYVDVSINGTAVGSVFVTGAADCAIPPDDDTLIVPVAVYNAAVDTGDVLIEMIPSVGVDPGICAETSIAVTIRYTTVSISADCNDSGVPDDCESLGVDFDVNGAVDLIDYRFLENCLAGSGVAPQPGTPVCGAACLSGFDGDNDGDVDLRDAAAFIPAFSP